LELVQGDPTFRIAKFSVKKLETICVNHEYDRQTDEQTFSYSKRGA